MEKGSKLKTILTTLLVLVLMVGSLILGYFVRDKEWIVVGKDGGATTLTVADVKYAVKTIKNDFEKTYKDSNESGAKSLAATTADSYFDLSTGLYKDMDEDFLNAFYANEDISIASQIYDFNIKPILYMTNSEGFNIDGEIFEWTVPDEEWEWGLPTKYSIQRCKCTVNENNVIELILCSYDTINDDWGTPGRIFIDFDFEDDSYVLEVPGTSAIAYLEVDPSAFPDDFDQLALTRYAGIIIKRDSEVVWNEEREQYETVFYEGWDIDHCHITDIQDYDLANEKYCNISDWENSEATHIGVKNTLGETECRRLIKEYFFDSGLLELPEKLAEELGIEE